MPSHSIDHVAVAVRSIRAAAPLYELLSGDRCSPSEELPDQGVRVSFVGRVELVEPLDPEGTVARFLERRGPGIHHLAYRVEDLRGELARLAAEGFELIDPEPREGAGGHRVAFLHPRSTGGVLIELVEATPPPGVTPPR